MKTPPAVLAAPWAIEAQTLRVIYSIWSRGKLEATALSQAKSDWEARKSSRPRLDEQGAAVEGTGGTLRIVGNVGVISIDGALFRHADMFTEISGGTTYDAIWGGLEAALSSRQVAGILLRINSPGGEADGCSELGKGIASASKPIWAYVDGMAASAAYWLASQTDRIVAEETSEAGSIGVRCGILDDSVADEMAGIRQIEIISSQSPAKRSKPIDGELLSRVQTRIDDLADRFVAAVATGRGVSVDQVLTDFGQGDVMIAAKAKKAGLVDQIGNFNTTLAALSEAAANAKGMRVARAKGKPMVTEETITAGDSPEWQCAGCNEMMGPSAKAYCAKCSEDSDGDEDGDEAKALGLDPKATSEQRRARMVNLVSFSAHVVETLKAESLADARGRVVAAAEAQAELPKVREALAAELSDGIRRDLRATLEAGLDKKRLSLGGIQKSIPRVLRGAELAAWTEAMGKIKSTTRENVIDAACSVPLGREDLEAISGWVQSSEPIAASAFEEPPRDPSAESVELDERGKQIKAAADAARKTFDRAHEAPKTL